MTPKEKAEELLNKMLSKNPNRQDGISMIDTIQAKQCALIAVDEIMLTSNNIQLLCYFEEVRTEIEKL
jgi:hypothetical protein